MDIYINMKVILCIKTFLIMFFCCCSQWFRAYFVLCLPGLTAAITFDVFKHHNPQLYDIPVWCIIYGLCTNVVCEQGVNVFLNKCIKLSFVKRIWLPSLCVVTASLWTATGGQRSVIHCQDERRWKWKWFWRCQVCINVVRYKRSTLSAWGSRNW